MTEKEAIKELKILREDYWDEYGDTMPALDMAIKALEQHNIDKLIGKLEDEKFKLCNDDIHCGFDGGLERAKQIVKEFYEVAE